MYTFSYVGVLFVFNFYLRTKLFFFFFQNIYFCVVYIVVVYTIDIVTIHCSLVTAGRSTEVRYWGHIWSEVEVSMSDNT